MVRNDAGNDSGGRRAARRPGLGRPSALPEGRREAGLLEPPALDCGWWHGTARLGGLQLSPAMPLTRANGANEDWLG